MSSTILYAAMALVACYSTWLVAINVRMLRGNPRIQQTTGTVSTQSILEKKGI